MKVMEGHGKYIVGSDATRTRAFQQDAVALVTEGISLRFEIMDEKVF